MLQDVLWMVRVGCVWVVSLDCLGCVFGLSSVVLHLRNRVEASGVVFLAMPLGCFWSGRVWAASGFVIWELLWGFGQDAFDEGSQGCFSHAVDLNG